MTETVNKAVSEHFGVLPNDIKPLGGGFYGRVFLISIDREPYSAVLKLYLFQGLAVREAEQLKMLSKHSLLKVPEVYGVYEKNSSGFCCDVLFMEYIKGVNAGVFDASALAENVRMEIGESIVDNLISIHSTVNSEGFGELKSEKYCPVWQEYYYPIAESIVIKAGKLYEQGQISSEVMAVFNDSLKQFDSIFSVPVTQARLIHGDYNTWNIMLDECLSRAEAVIDPFNCCFADSELDLYQLDNANGREYGLLKRYSEKVPLSENFNEKRSFYELYSEINHYYDSGVRVDQAHAERLAKALKSVL